ncbi:hypothetical protein GIB67_015784 [Kingdonia uniflora]|uniref:Uncharacterized protein n=1 Tax=Kingdonia uniflora TaxID=39325 RepID=A0A7J7NV19_9MAGN|nr:hypothetical protein GIB67_015784 [Kingdonia uniflora]
MDLSRGEERKSGVLGDALQERATESKTDDIGEKAKTCTKSGGKETMKGVLFHAEEASVFNMKEQVFTKQVKDSGVLNGSLRSRSNSLGLHMPLVCHDGVDVAYACKRQLAGQACASAVDRTRAILMEMLDQSGGASSVIVDEVIREEACLFVESRTLGDISTGEVQVKP